jgi:threonine dehydrogenase-like Zn-dependent dehydrogenase
MKALIVERDGSVSVQEAPIPQYNDYEVLVKLQASAICGTDIKIIHNTLKEYSNYPTILGHEGVGVVCEVGKKVRNLKIGDKIVGPAIFGKCGDYFSTWGAMAEYGLAGDVAAMVEDGLVKVADKDFHRYVARQKIPKELDSVSATMILTFREVYSTMKRLNFTAGQNIVVYGAGPVGLSFIKFAKLIGMNPIIGVDIDERKLISAKAMGADIVINSQKTDVEKEIKKLFPDGADILLDAAGVPSLINTSLKLVKSFGQVCVYGVTPKNELLMNWQEAPYTFDLRFVQWTVNTEKAAVHEEIVQWMLEGKLDGMDFISDVFSFQDWHEAIEMFKDHKNEKKIVFKF